MNSNLVDFFDEPARIVIRATPDATPEEYVLSPLAMADRIQAAAHIRDERVAALLTQKHVHMLQPEIVASALASTLCNPIDTDEILRGHESQLYLVFLSLRRANKSITWEQVQALPSMTTEVLGRVLLAITGLINKATPEEDAGADPTDSIGNPTAISASTGKT